MEEQATRKTVNEIDEEIERNIAVVDKFIKKQQAGIELSEEDKILQAEASYRVTTLLWVLGQCG
ncbi:hypothetical protein [Rummeliibacillus stabekisii]|uniref:Uncharacterized protein n=1 Tax=Rummeliibacillus stabekisii TaxID=241244 RepID=A0A143HAF3_9BACL|nr:hypothetical protein [Rummeliibacillus stabekisii]AMW98429.1 hypothetical protein ATY39_02670 [Rummeliibacillus stabekisii]